MIVGLASRQTLDGWQPVNEIRTPISGSAVVATALAVRALRALAPPVHRTEMTRRSHAAGSCSKRRSRTVRRTARSSCSGCCGLLPRVRSQERKRGSADCSAPTAGGDNVQQRSDGARSAEQEAALEIHAERPSVPVSRASLSWRASPHRYPRDGGASGRHGACLWRGARPPSIGKAVPVAGGVSAMSWPTRI